jgi:hypothetical protein
VADTIPTMLTAALLRSLAGARNVTLAVPAGDGRGMALSARQRGAPSRGLTLQIEGRAECGD